MIIDLTKDNVVFDGCEANIDRATGEIRTTPDGINKWNVYILVHEEGETRSKPMKLNMAASKDPAAGLVPYQPISVKGCRLNVYNIDGSTVNSYTAESIAKA